MLRAYKTHLGRILDARFPKLWELFNILRRDRNMEPEFWLVPYLCELNSIALDVGANTGIYTLYMSRYARLVLAFEPNLECLNRLAARSPSNAVVIFGAVSEGSGVAQLRYDSMNTGIGTVEPKNTLQQFDGLRVTSFSVPTFCLDALGLEDVAFIKIDVEGHESSVINGALKTLSREHPALLIESEDRHVPGAVREIYSRLTAIGYSGYVLEDKRLVRVPAPSDEDDVFDAQISGKYNFVFLHDEKREAYKARLAPEFSVA